jgi:hypothetical protein
MAAGLQKLSDRIAEDEEDQAKEDLESLAEETYGINSAKEADRFDEIRRDSRGNTMMLDGARKKSNASKRSGLQSKKAADYMS